MTLAVSNVFEVITTWIVQQPKKSYYVKVVRCGQRPKDQLMGPKKLGSMSIFNFIIYILKFSIIHQPKKIINICENFPSVPNSQKNR